MLHEHVNIINFSRTDLSFWWFHICAVMSSGRHTARGYMTLADLNVRNDRTHELFVKIEVSAPRGLSNCHCIYVVLSLAVTQSSPRNIHRNYIHTVIDR